MKLPKINVKQALAQKPKFTTAMFALGGIDGGNAHGDLLVSAGRAATGGEGVAVADGDDQAKQGRDRQG